MPRVFSSIFNNDDRNEGVRSLRLAQGSARGLSLLEHTQSRAARRAALRQENLEFGREATPFDFNIGRYQVSLSSDTMLWLRD